MVHNMKEIYQGGIPEQIHHSPSLKVDLWKKEILDGI